MIYLYKGTRYLDITYGETRPQLMSQFNYELPCWTYMCHLFNLDIDKLKINKEPNKFLFCPDFSDDVYEIYFDLIDPDQIVNLNDFDTDFKRDYIRRLLILIN